MSSVARYRLCVNTKTEHNHEEKYSIKRCPVGRQSYWSFPSTPAELRQSRQLISRRQLCNGELRYWILEIQAESNNLLLGIEEKDQRFRRERKILSSGSHRVV